MYLKCEELKEILTALRNFILRLKIKALNNFENNSPNIFNVIIYYK